MAMKRILSATAVEMGDEIDRLRDENERLRAVIEDAGHYVAVCPVPSNLAMDSRVELNEKRHRIAKAASTLAGSGGQK